MQNCSLCHLPYHTEDKTGKRLETVGPVLAGFLKKQNSPAEGAVRALIANGIPQKMPAFRYGLEAKEIDLIIEFLKVY